jgi:hypothetical protein
VVKSFVHHPLYFLRVCPYQNLVCSGASGNDFTALGHAEAEAADAVTALLAAGADAAATTATGLTPAALALAAGSAGALAALAAAAAPAVGEPLTPAWAKGGGDDWTPSEPGPAAPAGGWLGPARGNPAAAKLAAARCSGAVARLAGRALNWTTFVRDFVLGGR